MLVDDHAEPIYTQLVATNVLFVLQAECLEHIQGKGKKFLTK